jgi:hypothetical protein
MLYADAASKARHAVGGCRRAAHARGSFAPGVAGPGRGGGILEAEGEGKSRISVVRVRRQSRAVKLELGYQKPRFWRPPKPLPPTNRRRDRSVATQALRAVANNAPVVVPRGKADAVHTVNILQQLVRKQMLRAEKAEQKHARRKAQVAKLKDKIEELKRGRLPTSRVAVQTRHDQRSQTRVERRLRSDLADLQQELEVTYEKLFIQDEWVEKSLRKVANLEQHNRLMGQAEATTLRQQLDDGFCTGCWFAMVLSMGIWLQNLLCILLSVFSLMPYLRKRHNPL